jgi:hypothetical protein
MDDASRTDVSSRVAPRLCGMTLDEQETTPAITFRKWYKKAAILGRQHVEPRHCNVTNSGIDDNRIRRLVTTEGQPIGSDHSCMWPANEIVSRSPSKLRINLDGCYTAASTNYFGKDGAVVTRPSADVNDMRPRREVEKIIKLCPKGWLAIIDPSCLVEGN